MTWKRSSGVSQSCSWEQLFEVVWNLPIEYSTAPGKRALLKTIFLRNRRKIRILNTLKQDSRPFRTHWWRRANLRITSTSELYPVSLISTCISGPLCPVVHVRPHKKEVLQATFGQRCGHNREQLECTRRQRNIAKDGKFETVISREWLACICQNGHLQAIHPCCDQKPLWTRQISTQPQQRHPLSNIFCQYFQLVHCRSSSTGK